MTYEEQLNWFWQLDEVHSFTGNETKLYLYLLRIAMNSLGACESFQQSNERVAGNTGLTVNELRTARNRLMQIGMIVFTTGGKGRNDVSRWSLVTPKGLKKGGSKVDPKVYPKVNPKVYPKIDPLIPFPSDSPILEIQIPPDIPEGISAPTGAKTAKSTGKPDDLDEVIRYGEEIGLPLNECQKFFDHFTSNGWRVSGKAAMKDWKAALRNWKRNGENYAQPITRQNHRANPTGFGPTATIPTDRKYSREW